MRELTHQELEEFLKELRNKGIKTVDLESKTAQEPAVKEVDNRVFDESFYSSMTKKYGAGIYDTKTITLGDKEFEIQYFRSLQSGDEEIIMKKIKKRQCLARTSGYAKGVDCCKNKP